MFDLLLVGFLMASLAMGVAAIFFAKKFVWWEYVILAITPIAISFFSCLLDGEIRSRDTEYFTNTVKRVEYIEYWETYVNKTCTRSYDCNCGTDRDGRRTCQTCYESYDCSYCDINDAEYWAYDENGRGMRISKGEYYRIKNKFGNEKFVDLNRNINYSMGCGRDGNKYVSEWDGNLDLYEPFCTAHSYINKVRLSNTYNFRDLNEAELKRVKNYPKISSVYQTSIVGQWVSRDDLEKARFKLDRFNGLNGKNLQIKAFIFTYYNESSDVVDLQRLHFEGGNKNEIIICVGYNEKGVTFVRAFSWTDEKICENEAVRFYSKDMKLEALVDHMIPVWTKNWKRKEFTSLNDLVQSEPSASTWVLIIFLEILLTAFLVVAFKNNEFEH